tara:strand:- start:19 stop:276 length:258 start_codon:yes stop_codon:yes gene_type:complete
MGYNYAAAFAVNELEKLDPASAEYQLAQELTVTALITFRHDFGDNVQIHSVSISAKIQVVTVKGYDEMYQPCAGFYSFKELGFSV